MELWIRSQNKKKLIKVDMIEIDKQIEGPAIIFSHEYTLGEYDSKERALEVLDEIQEFIENEGKSYSTSNESGFSCKIEYRKVYEMPEDVLSV